MTKTLSYTGARKTISQSFFLDPWTAQWVLGRTLARGAIVPVGDVGVQAMLGALTGAGRKLTPVEVRTWANAWGSDALLALNYIIVGAWRGIRLA